MRVRYSLRAAEDLEDIQLYISNDNPDAAWIVASAIRRSIARLLEWPHSAQTTDKAGVRRLVIATYPYVAFYTVQQDQVLILTICHQRQKRA